LETEAHAVFQKSTVIIIYKNSKTTATPVYSMVQATLLSVAIPVREITCPKKLTVSLPKTHFFTCNFNLA